MGLIFVFILICILVPSLIWMGLKGASDQKQYTQVWGIITPVFLLGISIWIVADSYNAYCNLRGEKVAIEQYASSLRIYIAKANVPAGVQSQIPGVTISDLTDRKYESYQEYLSRNIGNLRTKVEGYNEALVSKRLYDGSWFFGLLIYGPDKDMQPIEMQELVPELLG